jgi:GxxExxY protein
MVECISPTCESIVTRANQYHCSSCSKNIGTKLLATCNRIYHLSEEVNNALYHEYSGSVERHYQDAFSSELRKQKFRYQSETSIALHYNDFPLNDVRADYFILPGGPNKFEENIVLEVKHASSTAHQLQLFNYLHSGPTNNNLLTKKLRYGILLIWPKQNNPIYSDDGRFAELSSVQPPTMELWVTSNPRKRTKFELLSRWGE